jgi:MATE family multidrug resistance protein
MLDRAAVATELRATLGVAAPLIGANLAQMTMAFTDTVMVGRLGAGPLAAAGLGGMLYFTTGLVMQGVVLAVTPLAGHAIGAGERAGAGRIAGAGLVLAALLAVPLIAIVALLGRLLVALGYDAGLAAEVARFLDAIAWGAPAFLGAAALRCLLAALADTRPMMVVLTVGIAVNAGLNWVLIFGHLGLPALGVAGSGYATAVIHWLILGSLALYVRLAPRHRALSLTAGLARCRPTIVRLIRLGTPIAAILGLELGVFGLASVLMGLLGVAALGAHQVVINVVSITFMVPLGLAQAATARVAVERGAGRAVAARRAARVALALGVGCMAISSLVLWRAARTIVSIYVDLDDPANHALEAIALRLLAIGALFQVFDGAQVIAVGALRGYHDTSVPMVLAAVGYWGIGFVGGWLLAFPLGYGAVGLWWGLALGLAVVAALLGARLYRLADQPKTTLTIS